MFQTGTFRISALINLAKSNICCKSDASCFSFFLKGEKLVNSEKHYRQSLTYDHLFNDCSKLRWHQTKGLSNQCLKLWLLHWPEIKIQSIGRVLTTTGLLQIPYPPIFPSMPSWSVPCYPAFSHSS